MSNIVKVPFRGDEILTVDHGGRVHVILKPALDALGLDFDSQRQKLAGKSWACTVLITAQLPGDVQRREVVAVDVRTFLMLLATIDERRVAATVRPKLVAYQAEVADAIERYWTTGHVINPRLVGDNFFEPNTLSWEEVALLIRQRYGLRLTVNDLTRMLRTAGVLKQTGMPRKEYEHLFWFTGSALNVHPHVLPELVRRLEITAREIQDWRFLQARLEIDGVGANPAEVEHRKPGE